MEKIYTVDLTGETISCRDYDVLTEKDYGRGLALRLLEETVPPRTGRFSPDNALVFVPGLLTGCCAPSTGRMTLMAKGGESSVGVCNLTGNMPQKLGSLGICALVVTGACADGSAVLHIDRDGARLLHMPELKGRYTEEIIAALKERFGADAAIIGTGIGGERGYSLGTVFATYPDGEPEYNCPRNALGDIVGSKGLKAVVVSCEGYFGRACADAAALLSAGRAITKLITDNDMCGGALPAYGSMTLIDLVERGEIPPRRETARMPLAPEKTGRKRNFCCAPMCVIGCLNRHSAVSGVWYEAPAQSELATALKNCFGLADDGLMRRLQKRLRQLCLVSPEFVTAARSYFVAVDETPTPEGLLALVDEIERDTEVGRLVASRTKGIAAAYPDNAALRALIDKPAIADEPDFRVRRAEGFDEFAAVSDMELMYDQIFVLENLGFCIFTAFALVNNAQAMELMAELFRSRTGAENVSGAELIRYAAACIRREQDYAAKNGAVDPRPNIPPFTRMLYRYFSK